jgi:hypothetical protein
MVQGPHLGVRSRHAGVEQGVQGGTEDVRHEAAVQAVRQEADDAG